MPTTDPAPKAESTPTAAIPAQDATVPAAAMAQPLTQPKDPAKTPALP